MKLFDWQSCQRGTKAILVGYCAMAGIFLSSIAIAAALPTVDTVPANLRSLSASELSAFDGKDNRPAYVGYKGLIYDVSTSPLFDDGAHYGHLAGRDLTAAMAGAPHGDELLAPFPVVGKLSTTSTPGAASPSSKPILLLGKTMTAWSGYLFAIVFIANFLTCYVMPWCARSVPWRGTIPGPDKWDQSIVRLSYYHRYFAWLTIALGIIHGVLGIFQSFGIRI